jgi:CRISPR/Cas system CMR-associated protein Cmr1 (group 7 of RAMP superfamily)
MRLRVPKDKVAQLGGGFSLAQTLKSLGEQARSAEQGKWQSYKIEVITPIFGGGVKAGEPDTQMPIRASAIRGQLRYWWRFLAKAENKKWSNEDLFEKEREIWGGMAEEGEDFSSKVKIRIKLLSKIPSLAPYVNQQPRYALFSAREQTQTVPPQPAKKLLWPDPNKKRLIAD